MSTTRTISDMTDLSAIVLRGKPAHLGTNDVEFCQLSMTRISKEGLRSSKVIGQVDKKFVLIVVDGSHNPKDGGARMAVLVDQHAADERVRVESLLINLCKRASTATKEFTSSLLLCSSIETRVLQEPILLHVSKKETGLFRHHAPHFAYWGILFDLESVDGTNFRPISTEEDFVRVTTVPDAIAERCRVDSNHLLQIMRKEIYAREESFKSTHDLSKSTATRREARKSSIDVTEAQSWALRIRTCPQGILDMIYSRSCRSALMFNDELDVQECKNLIRGLSDCSFPFQCAHGRPTMIPLVEFDISNGTSQPGGVLEGQQFPGRKSSGSNDFFEAWTTWSSSLAS